MRYAIGRAVEEVGAAVYRLSCRTAVHDHRLDGYVGYVTSLLCNGGDRLAGVGERLRGPTESDVELTRLIEEVEASHG